MNKKDLQSIYQMEQEIIKFLKKSFGKNLISLLVEGSYGTYDYIKGYSDYDLLALVRDVDLAPNINLTALSKKYHIDIQCSTKSYNDLQNRIKNNNKSSRFIGNLNLIKIKKQVRLLHGKDVVRLIPSVSELITRDLGGELRADYYHATNLNPNWNIFNRDPKKWVNYIINMGNNLLLSQGVVVKKAGIPTALKKHCPNFKGTMHVIEALRLRRSKEVLSLTATKKKALKKSLTLFLAEYKRYTFY